MKFQQIFFYSFDVNGSWKILPSNMVFLTSEVSIDSLWYPLSISATKNLNKFKKKIELWQSWKHREGRRSGEFLPIFLNFNTY